MNQQALSEFDTQFLATKTQAEADLAQEEVVIEPDENLTTFAEEVYYDGQLCSGITSKGLDFDAHIRGRVRKNLSEDPKRSSSLKIDLFDPEDSKTQARIGGADISIFEPSPGLLRAFEITPQPDQKIVVITTLLSSQRPRMGIGSKIFEVVSGTLPRIVDQTVEAGVFPLNTLFIRVIIDQASLDGWTKWQTDRMKQNGEDIVETKAGTMFYQIIKPNMPRSDKQQAFKEKADEKNHDLQQRLNDIQTSRAIESSDLHPPKFDSETGESLDGMPITQLSNLVRELEKN